jgi:hypothetical protein
VSTLKQTNGHAQVPCKGASVMGPLSVNSRHARTMAADWVEGMCVASSTHPCHAMPRVSQLCNSEKRFCLCERHACVCVCVCDTTSLVSVASVTFPLLDLPRTSMFERTRAALVCGFAHVALLSGVPHTHSGHEKDKSLKSIFGNYEAGRCSSLLVSCRDVHVNVRTPWSLSSRARRGL